MLNIVNIFENFLEINVFFHKYFIMMREEMLEKKYSFMIFFNFKFK